MDQKNYNNIIFSIDGETAFLTINRPPVNILDIATMEEMNDVLDRLKDNSDVKVLVITGAGEKAFSAGVDVSDHTEDKVDRMLEVFHDIFRKMSKLDQVTVAAIKGLTLGGGCEVAIFCDTIIAADNVKIGQPEIKLAVFPPIALLVFPRLVGLKRASELLLSGKVIDANEAERIGLINKVVPLESFESEVKEFIHPFLELSAVGIKYSKKGINLGLETGFMDGLEKIEKIYKDELMASEDAHEGLKSFLEKRKPIWKNK
ncbi:MAG: enoyl-CoA hydratase/isomerase family protein [Candidatus Aminicenantes bacterium]|jgi:cyclohexa-1,5-dienecarbonyl-CoA hydratase